jgi:GntR family transcriptional repressor for pyruvate dehydrogenase complex
MPEVQADQPDNGSSASDDEVLERLRELIRDGRYVEGAKLPPERELAERLGVSRRAVKKAFAVLEAEGKVWRGVGQGTFVGRRGVNWSANLTALARSSSPTAVLEARLAFEPTVARYAAQRATASHVQQMKEVLEKGLNARTVEEFQLWDERFHELLVSASQNTVFEAVQTVLAGAWSAVNWGAAAESAYSRTWRLVYSRQHRAITEALENRDLDRVENLVLEHWQTLRSNLVADPIGDKGRRINGTA